MNRTPAQIFRLNYGQRAEMIERRISGSTRGSRREFDSEVGMFTTETKSRRLNGTADQMTHQYKVKLRNRAATFTRLFMVFFNGDGWPMAAAYFTSKEVGALLAGRVRHQSGHYEFQIAPTVVLAAPGECTRLAQEATLALEQQVGVAV